MMRERRYEGDVRVRSPPPPPSRVKIRERHYSPRRRENRERDSRFRIIPGLGSGSSESERLRRTGHGSSSVERRSYDKHFEDGDRDRQLRRLSQFNESLSRGNSTSMKFQWKHLLTEPTILDTSMNYSSKHSSDYGVSPTRVATERNHHHSSRFSDMGLSGMLLEKPMSVENEKGKICRYPPDVGVSKGSGHSHRGFALLSQNSSIGLCKDEELGIRDSVHLDRRVADKPSSRELENPRLYSKNPSDYLVSVSRSKALDTLAPGILKEDLLVFSKASPRIPSDGFRPSPGITTTPISSNGYGQKSHIKSPADPEMQLNDMRSYPLAYHSPTEGKYYNYAYSEVHRSERIGMGKMSDEFYGKTASIRENHSSRDLRTRSVDAIVDRINECSQGEHLRESRLWGHPPSSQGHPIPNYLDTSRLLVPREQDGKASGYRSSQLKCESEVYQDDGNVFFGEVHCYKRDDGPWSREERSEMSPRIEHDPGLDKIDGGPQERLSAGGLGLHEPARKMHKRKCGMDNKLSRHNFGSKFLSSRKTAYNNCIVRGADKQQTREEVPSKRLRFSHSKYGKSRTPNEMGGHKIFNSGGWSPDNVSLSMPRRLSKTQKCGSRDIKKRLGPAPQNFNVSVPWVKHNRPYKFPKRIQDDFHRTLHVEGGGPLDCNITRPKTEPAENSEDFKQLVRSAFFKFVKQLNENTAQRRRFMEQGKAGSLKCSICGSDSEEFVDTESLVVHAHTSPKVGCRSQHLGFYKALCALMGWQSALAPNHPGVPQLLSNAENLALKEDLIIWPPVVIIHNSSIRNNNPDEQVIVSVEVLEAMLKDMGFGEKTKVCHGKPANQSIMVVRFNSTFSGLQEAERLHKFYAETKHGRAEFQESNSIDRSSTSREMLKLSTNKLEHILYGYLGVAEDLDKLDFKTKKRCLVKSKKELLEIADAPVNTE